MRVVWSAMLVVGLGLVGLSVYEAQQTAQAADSSTMEDGVGYPAPPPTPKPSQF